MGMPRATTIMAALACLAFVTSGACASDGAPPTAAGAADTPDGQPTILLSQLDGADTPAEFVLDVDEPGATSAKLVTDGAYQGESEEPPLEFAMSLDPGEHRVRVRSEVDGETVRTDARFTVVGAAPTTTLPTTPPSVVPTSTAPGGDGTDVDDTAELLAAVEAARPGDVIVLADGEYRFDDRFVLAASGSAEAPITLRGGRGAIVRTKNASGDYGIHVTGSYWRIEGLTVAHATKGIVLDGSRGTVIDGVEIFDVGDEAVHFRSCSSDGILRNSYIHQTGRNSPQYGEGVYVGSAESNWDKYECTDPVEGSAEGDNTERVLVEDNVFEDITAEGADLKEGTDSGTVRNNVFRRVGLSGQNSADSAVDAKGNSWVVEGNLVTGTDADWDDDGTMRPSEFVDGFQTHDVRPGWGDGNVFRNNIVEGTISGFGIGLYPALDNIVTCDNVAPGAAEGLVGDNGRAGRCSDG
jgi:Right handed beta helix region